jgi:hypothetical protein
MSGPGRVGGSGEGFRIHSPTRVPSAVELELPELAYFTDFFGLSGPMGFRRVS